MWLLVYPGKYMIKCSLLKQTNMAIITCVIENMISFVQTIFKKSLYIQQSQFLIFVGMMNDQKYKMVKL